MQSCHLRCCCCYSCCKHSLRCSPPAPLGPAFMLTCPAQHASFRGQQQLLLPGTRSVRSAQRQWRAAAGMRDGRQKSQNFRHCRQDRLVHGASGLNKGGYGRRRWKNNTNKRSGGDEQENSLTFPRLQENRVGHDIFNLHCHDVNPE